MGTKRASRPFYDISDEYEESLAIHTRAAMELYVSVIAAIRWVDSGHDPAEALRGLRDHAERFYQTARGE